MERMEQYIKEDYLITDLDKCLDEFEFLLQQEISMYDIINFVTQQKNTIFHFDKNFGYKNKNDDSIQFAWIDSGYCHYEKPIFISLVKNSIYNEFQGYFVGTANYLIEGMKNNGGNYLILNSNLEKFKSIYNYQIEKRTIKHLDYDYETFNDDIEETNNIYVDNEMGINDLKNDAVINDLYNNLLYKNWNSIEGFSQYLKRIGSRLIDVISNNSSNYYISNNKDEIAIINSGLINNFGNYIYLLYEFNNYCNSYKFKRVISGKTDYLKCGFTTKDANTEIKPIQFEDTKQVLSCMIEDYDLNQQCLMHIIEERRERFPETIQKNDSVNIASRLITELKLGLKIQNSDDRYAKKIYSCKDKKISWILPLHIENKTNGEPELVMAIRKNNAFFEVKTILPYDIEMKDKIRSMELYGNIW